MGKRWENNEFESKGKNMKYLKQTEIIIGNQLMESLLSIMIINE